MAKEEKTAAEKYREERKARIAKAAKKNNKKAYNPQAGKTAGKVLAVLLVVAIVAGIAAFAVNYTGLVEKNRVAMTIGDVEVSQPEYAYYYSSGYNMVSQYAKYGMISFDTATAPAKQTYSNIMGEIPDFPEDQTPTWADFFEYYAERNLKYIKAAVKVAAEKGITLDDSDMKAVQENIDTMKSQAESNNFSLNAYLRRVCGKGFDSKLLKTVLEEQQLTQKVEETKTNELKASYTDKDIEKEYKANTQDYATITYRSYKFKAETVKSDDSTTESATDETLAAAKKEAESFLAEVTDEKSFKKLASENEKKLKNSDYKDYLENDRYTLTEDSTYSTLSGSVTDEDFLKWAFSSDTKGGDTYLLKNSDGYTAYLMVNPIHKAGDILTYDVRHILIKFPTEETKTGTDSSTTADDKDTTSEESTTEAETTAAAKEAEDVKVETLDTSKYEGVGIYLDVNADTAKDKASYKKAQDILEEYLNGDRTADAFEALQNKYSEDTRDSDGDLKYTVYEDTKKGDMVAEFEDWALTDGRKEGDVGIVETEYGYHIMYFVKTETTTWKDTVASSLASSALSDYQQEIMDADNVKVGNKNEKALTAVDDFLASLIKSNASANSSSQS